MSSYTRGPLVASNCNGLGAWCIYHADRDAKECVDKFRPSSIGELIEEVIGL